MSDPNIDTTDAGRGQTLVNRVETRKTELKAAAAGLPLDNHVRQDIEAALAAVAGLLPPDLDPVPHTVAADLSQWLERNKYLGERHGAAPTPTPAVESTLEEKSPEA